MTITPTAGITTPGSIPPYMYGYQPYTNITPFTYRDGLTFLEVFEAFVLYLNNTVIPFINDNFSEFDDEFTADMNTLIDQVNQQIADLTKYVDDSIASIINSSITVSDPVIHGVISNPVSQSYNDIKNMVIAGQGRTYYIPNGSTAAQAQAILTAAESGSTVVFSPGAPYTSPVANGFTVANDGVTIDSRRATINAPTWGVPAFDFIGRSVVILYAGIVQFTGVRGATGGQTFRGSAAYIGTCAVYINRDNCRVETLHAIGFVVGVYLAAWDGTSVNDRYGKHNFIGAIEVEKYNFGVLWVMQQDLKVRGGYFHDDLDDSAGANPCHAVYGSSTTGARDTVVLLQDLRCENNLSGQAYQAKYSDQLNVRNLRGNNCAGIFNAIDCNDMSINGMVSLLDRMPTSVGSFSIQSTNNISLRPRIGNISISSIDNANFHAFQAICTDGIINNISIDVGYTGGSYSAGLSIYDIRGDRNRVSNIFGRSRINAISNGLVLNLVNGSAQGNIIEHAIFKNVAYAFFLAPSSLDTAIEVNDNLQNYVTNLFTIGAGATYSVVGMQSLGVSLSTLGENAVLNYLAKDSPVHGPGANSGTQVKIRPTRDITVTNLYWYSVVSSGNYDIGVYDDLLNTCLYTKGSTPFPVAGLVSETVGTPFVLKAGRTYRIVFAADNVVCSYRGVTGLVSGMDKLLAGGTSITTVSAIFPLPTASLVAGATAIASFPLIMLAGTKANVN